MHPLIGITSDWIESALEGREWSSNNLLCHYTAAFAAAGALPVMLPLARGVDCGQLVRRLDGVVLSGGVADIPPEVYGAPRHPATAPMPMARWHSDVAWFRAARDAGLPLLGICLGMQVMHLVAGGTLIQDIPAERPGDTLHTAAHRMQPHSIRIKPGSKLAALAPADTMEVISAHHQAIHTPTAPYVATATTADGIVEAIEDPTCGFAVGVQWHPERLANQPDWLLTGFAQHCARRMETLDTVVP